MIAFSRRCPLWWLFFALFASQSSLLLADTVVAVKTSQLGGFFSDGGLNNSPDVQHYNVGYSTLSSRAERRSFFLFDVPAFEPSHDELAGIELSLYLPFGGLVYGQQLDESVPPKLVVDT